MVIHSDILVASDLNLAIREARDEKHVPDGTVVDQTFTRGSRKRARGIEF